MKIAIIDLYTKEYQTMAEITVPRKIAYAEKHGYIYLDKTDNFIPDKAIGYQKCYWLSELMRDHPEIDWFLHLGTDCLITNHTVTLESIIDNDYHFMVTKDPTGINGENFFIRNSLEGREYIERLKEVHPLWNTEEGNMRDDEHNPKWRAITKYLPQCTINSYDKKWYPHLSELDQLGSRCGWLPTDFVLHAITGLIGATHGLGDPIRYEWKMNILRSHLDDEIK